VNLSFEDAVQFLKDLEELKTSKLAKDFILSKSGDMINILIKSKNKRIEKIKKFFEAENLKISKLSHKEYLKYKINNFGVLNKEAKIFRRLKLRLDKNLIVDAMKKVLKLANEFKTDISYHLDMGQDCVEINVYSEDDLTSIENSIFLIQRIINIADKNSGNMFSIFVFYVLQKITIN
jgi:hypothetical protein